MFIQLLRQLLQVFITKPGAQLAQRLVGLRRGLARRGQEAPVRVAPLAAPEVRADDDHVYGVADAVEVVFLQLRER